MKKSTLARLNISAAIVLAVSSAWVGGWMFAKVDSQIEQQPQAPKKAGDIEYTPLKQKVYRT